MTIPDMKATPIPILGLAHIGIRVHDLERSVRFYQLLGFTNTAGPIGSEPVATLQVDLVLLRAALHPRQQRHRTMG